MNPQHPLLTLCAWCQRHRADDGKWLSGLPEWFKPSIHAITHGICSECERSFRAQINEAQDLGQPQPKIVKN